MIDPYKAVEWYKQQYGVTNLSDYNIYEKVKKTYPDLDFTRNPFYDIPAESQRPSYEEQNKSGWDKILSFASLSDRMAQNNEWMQAAFNKSTAGTIYEIVHGKPKYDAPDAAEWYDEVGQFFVGMVSPVDVLTFFGSGAIGSMAAKSLGRATIRKWAIQGTSNMLGKKYSKSVLGKKLTNYLGSQAALESGLSLGTFGAAHGVLAESAKQSSEINAGVRKEFDPWGITWAGAKHGASNLALGSAAGYVARGKMGPAFAKAMLEKNPSFGNTVKKLTLNPVGQVAAESAVFTTGQMAEQLAMGEPLSMDNFLSGFFMNTGIIGGLRLGSKVTRLGQDDVTRYEKAKNDFYGESFTNYLGKKVKGKHQQEIEALNRTKDELINQNLTPPQELLDKIALLEADKMSDLAGISTYKKALKNYNDVLKLLNVKKGAELTAEQQAMLLKEVGTIQNVLHTFFTELKNDKELAYQVYKDGWLVDGKPIKALTKEHTDLIDIMVDSKLKQIETANNVVNDIAAGNTGALERLKSAYADNFTKKVTQTKDKKWELSIESPEGIAWTLPDYFKIHSSEKTANQLGEVLLKETKKQVKKNIDKVEAGEKVNYVPWNRNTNQPMVDNNGNPVVRSAPAKEVQAMIADGTAKSPGDLAGNTQVSGNQINSTFEKITNKQLTTIIEGQRAGANVSESLSINRKSYDKKLSEYETFLNLAKQDKNLLSDSDRKIFEEIFEIPISKKTGKSTADGPESAYLLDYLNKFKLENEPTLIGIHELFKSDLSKEHVQKIIKFAAFLKKEKGIDLHNLTADIFNSIMKKELSSFKIEWTDNNGNIRTKTIRKVDTNTLQSFTWLSGLSKGFAELNDIGLVNKDYYRALKTRIKEYYSHANENREGKPPIKGVRRFVLEKGKKFQVDKNDDGYYIASVLGAKYYMRQLEINKMSNAELKKAFVFEDPNLLGESYFILTEGIKKPRTNDRIVWIDKNFAADIQRFITEGKGLGKKHTTAITSAMVKEKMTNSKGIGIWSDLRRRGTTEGGKKLSDAHYRDLYVQQGHGKEAIKDIYDVKQVIEAIEAQKEIHSTIFPESFRKGIEFMIGKGETPAPLSVHKARQLALAKRYPELVFDIVKSFKDKDIPKDAVAYLEKAEDWVVRVKLGKAPAHAIPHEVLHYSFKLLDSMETHYKSRNLPSQARKTLKLYQEAKKIFVDSDGKFVGEEKAVRMMDKAVNDLLQRPLLGKAKVWLKRFTAFLKSIFNKKMSKDEMAYILGQKVIYRKGIPITTLEGKTEFLKSTSYASPQKFASAVNYELRLASDKFKMKYEELVEFLAKEAGIENPGDFKISVPKDELSTALGDKVEKLNLFYTKFQELNLDKFISKKSSLEKLKTITNIENTRVLEKGITNEKQIEYLKAFGVKDGNIRAASIEQLKNYSNYIHQLEPSGILKNNIEWISTKEMNNFVDLETAGKLRRLGDELTMALGETGSAIKRFGLKKLADKMYTHYAIEQGNQAPLLSFEINSKDILGKYKPTTEQKFHKIKENLWTLDDGGEMLIADLKWLNKEISSKDKKAIKRGEQFFRRAIKDEWWRTIKKDKKGADLRDYINMNTNEGKIALEYFKLGEAFGEKKFNQSLAQAAKSEAELQQIIDKTDVKFYGTYFSRIMNKHGRTALGKEGKVQRESFDAMAKEIAFDEVKKRHGEKAPAEKMYEGKEGETIWDYAQGIAWIRFHDMINFNPSKISTRHLKRRFSLQQLYVPDIKGKYQRVYHRKFDNTVKPYVWGMSKYYATLELFPEMVKLKGFTRAGLKEELGKLKQLTGRGKKIGRWVEEIVIKQLGMDTTSRPFDMAFGGLNVAARVASKLGLSFPTAGLKNILTGQTQSLYAMRIADWGRGMLDVFTADSKAYNRAVSTNAFQVGNKIYEGGPADRILDRVAFTWGFMRPTEKFNRLAVIYAAKYDIKRQMDRITRYPETKRAYKKAINRFKDFYRLNDGEISLLKKYGASEGVEGHLTGFEKITTMRQLDNIHQKMNTYAHVNTQGATADLFMPKWAGSQIAKPLTLFKRMAYAATNNTLRNTKLAIKNRNIIRPLMGLTATYFSGKTMIAVYNYILGTSMPKENSDWWKRFWTTMWKGEFLGILSDFFSPFEDRMTQSLNPAIYNNFTEIALGLEQVIEGKAFPGDAADRVLRRSVSLWNNYKKITERTLNPVNRDALRFDKLFDQFDDEIMERPDQSGLEGSKRTPYYKDLRDSFFFDDAETYARKLFLTYAGIAHDLYRTQRAETIDEAFKMSETEIKKKWKNFNPNKMSLDTTSKKSREYARKFMIWIAKHPEADYLVPRLQELEQIYKDRLKLYNSQVPIFWKKLDLLDFIDDFDWKRTAL